MPIKVLPPQLVNQIAAGEVVDRPATVVKELVENSIDAAATRIDIDIEHGGKKLIRIRDNGCGIKKNELTLALARHATSKIANLDDLEAIVSLGFRGEALASISFVSRLTLTSRPAEQQEAWQAYAEGRESATIISPAAHPVGTTLEVLDLFYNTPARRKFMRTDKTEFGYIDKIIRRMALARFDIAINLSHNGKIVRQYQRAVSVELKKRRLITICGTQFVEQARIIECLHDDLSLRGWVADLKDNSTAFADIQHCYVNGRVMRNRLINQAIYKAYRDKLGSAAAHQQPAFVLYLDIDPHQVDINVHPNKHEVRFQRSSLIHDFIYKGVMNVLQKKRIDTALILDDSYKSRHIPEISAGAASGCNQFNESVVSLEPASTVTRGIAAAGSSFVPSRVTCCANNYHHAQTQQQLALYRKLLETPLPPHKMVNSEPQIERLKYHQHHQQSFGRVLTIIDGDIALLERDGQQLALLALTFAERCLKQMQLMTACAKPLLRVQQMRLKIAPSETANIERYRALLAEIGIEISIDAQHVTICAVPLPLRQQNLQKIIPKLLDYLAQQTDFNTANIAQWLARNLVSEYTLWSMVQAINVLTELARLCPQLVKMPPSGLLQHVDLRTAKSALKDK